MDALPLLILAMVILGVFGTAAWASFRAAPFVPLRMRDVQRMLAIAKLRDGEQICDLGCGDGRLLFEAVRHHRVRAVGFEVSLLPYVLARLRRFRTRNQTSVVISYCDFFTADLRDIDVFFCFLTPMAMKKLARKFAAEAKEGARIVSYAFPIPGWVPTVTDKPSLQLGRIWRYDILPRKGG